MSRAADRLVRKAARSLARGVEFDWEAATTRSPEAREALAGLRIVEKIASLVRSDRMSLTDPTRPPHHEPSPGSTGTPADSHTPRSGLGTWGPLHVLEKIGEGSYGEVYRAFDPALQIEVALKLWFPGSSVASSAEEFLGEARALARIRHPNVLAVLGAASHGGRIGMWSELLRGETLEDCLARQGPFAATEAALIGAELCRALAAVHDAGLVHRDVKTRNAMREEGGRIVLMDFGTVRSTAASAAQGSTWAVGTPLSAAPEQLAGHSIGPTADLYSLGVVLYRLVSGRYPIEGRTLKEIRARHARGERTLLRDRRPDLPVDFVRAVERNLARDPAERHASAGAFERALLEFLALAPTLGAPEPARRRGPARRGSSRVRSDHNLPSHLTSFIGRERVMEECLAHLRGNRLVSLVGPGGCGKTRLALQMAERWLVETGDEVWFADLSSLAEGRDVPRELARILALRETRRPITETIVHHLLRHSALIVLDNCEHVIEGCATVVREVLEQARAVRVLATSREALRIPGEQTFVVPPLSVPPPEADGRREAVETYESVQLFLQRARLVEPSFGIDAERAPAVAEICRRLDGIPLALELAAGKLRALEVRDLQAMLEQHLGSLGDTGRAFVPRHRTLEAVFRWSYDLLDDGERDLLRALTVFKGPWRLEAAVAVCQSKDEQGILRVLERLVDKSLVVVDRRREAGVTYRLLETVQQLAMQRQGEGDAEELRGRHAAHYLARAPSIEAGLAGPEQGAWLDVVEAEHENLVAAIRWLIASPAGAHASLELASALWRYWYTRGLYSLGRGILSQALEARAPKTDPARAGALCAAAFLASFQGDTGAAAPMFQQSLQLYRAHGDRAGVARALSGLGAVATLCGNYAGARTHYEESLAIQRESESAPLLAIALNNLGAVTWRLGDHASAEAFHREGLAVAERSGHREGALLNLINLSWIALRRNRPDEACGWLLECSSHVFALGARLRAAEVLELAAEELSMHGRWAEAARLSGAAESVRSAIGTPAEDVWQKAGGAFRAAARQALGASALARELRAGRVLSLTQAMALARERLAEDRGAPSPSIAGMTGG